MFEWFFSILSYLGLYYKTAKILFLGLDNAGKTTLLRRMKDNVVGIYEPTFHPNYDILVVGGVQLHTFDLGGHVSSRSLWRSYWEDVDGIVFLVDAADSRRFDEAKKELHIILKEDNLAETPILVLGNKIDLPRAASKEILRNKLSFPQKKNGPEFRRLEATTGVLGPRSSGTGSPRGRSAGIFMCSVVKNVGYTEGFEWLSKVIIKN